jgi:ribosomal protein RSM22 (predicted rRNA methylase)/predicted RNA-binding protein YlxR (DUF448 family)
MLLARHLRLHPQSLISNYIPYSVIRGYGRGFQVISNKPQQIEKQQKKAFIQKLEQAVSKTEPTDENLLELKDRAKEFEIPLDWFDPESKEMQFINKRSAEFEKQFRLPEKKWKKRIKPYELEPSIEELMKLPEEWKQSPQTGNIESKRIMLTISPEERQDILNDLETFGKTWRERGYAVTLLDTYVVLHSITNTTEEFFVPKSNDENLLGSESDAQKSTNKSKKLSEKTSSTKQDIEVTPEILAEYGDEMDEIDEVNEDEDASNELIVAKRRKSDLSANGAPPQQTSLQYVQSQDPGDEFDPYRSLTPHERLVRVKKEWSIMTPGTVQLPVSLAARVKDIVSRYPKNSIRKTAQLLSATFRLRTGGYDNKLKLSLSGASPSLLPATNGTELSLFDQQMNLLRELRGYKDLARKGKSPDDFIPNSRSVRNAIEKAGTMFNPPIVYGEYEAVAYACHRLPAIYATTRRIFAEVSRRMPDWNPTTMLDFGTGPGTTIWSAKDTWTPSLSEITAIEPSTAMMGVASKILSGVNGITWRRFLNENARRKYDLVVASYVLNELGSDQERSRIIKTLWNMTRGVLVLVEAGTPMGFAQIRDARAQILAHPWKMGEAGGPATILAPCPHDGPCPLAGGGTKGNSWCHFVQRVDRELSFQKITKPDITQPFEDEKYSFVVFRRRDVTGLDDFEEAELIEDARLRSMGVSADERSLRKELRTHARNFAEQANKWPRIITRPIKRSGHTILDMCMSEGAAARVIVSKKSDRDGYKFSRKSWWGDLYPYELTAKNIKKIIDPTIAPEDDDNDDDDDDMYEQEVLDEDSEKETTDEEQSDDE